MWTNTFLEMSTHLMSIKFIEIYKIFEIKIALLDWLIHYIMFWVHIFSFCVLKQRIACHIQVFALTRWLPVTLPVEYYEFARGLQWSVPYMRLPWETGSMFPFMRGPSSPTNSHSYGSKINDFGMKTDKYNVDKASGLYGLPLSPMEYRSIFEVRIRNFHHNINTCSVIALLNALLNGRARIFFRKLSISWIHNIQVGKYRKMSLYHIFWSDQRCLVSQFIGA